MSILLLAECWPYRNVTARSFDNSDGRKLAYSAGITIQKLEQLCTCRYVFEKFIPSYKRKFKRYDYDLGLQFLKRWTQYGSYDICILLGKRLPTSIGFNDVPFFEPHFFKALQFAVIPNPSARFWWDDPDNVQRYRDFMIRMLTKHGGLV